MDAEDLLFLLYTSGACPSATGDAPVFHVAAAAPPLATVSLLPLFSVPYPPRAGSTGKPKGVAHSSGGYLLFTAITHKYIFDYRPGDVYACVADCGWITGEKEEVRRRHNRLGAAVPVPHPAALCG